MNSAAYILFITLYLTEGGTLEAEQDAMSSTLQECKIEARRQEQALREAFALAVQDRGMCPFRDVKIKCERIKNK